MEFIIGVMIGTGIGIFLSHVFDGKDKRIIYYRKALKICDDTIETLAEEKEKLQDEVKELKEYREEIKSHITTPISEKLIEDHTKIEVYPVRKLDLKKEGFVK